MKTTIKFPIWAKFTIILAFGISIFNGCQQIVTIDLNQANPHIVVEGKITDKPGPYTITLTKTGNYFADQLVFPPISNAIVVVTDDKGQKDTLKEISSGNYKSSFLQGIYGRTYSLSVIAEGQTYNAVSSMPHQVLIDSLYAIQRKAPNGELGYDIYVMFKDPPETANYYRINVSSSAIANSDSIDGQRYRIYSDKLTNGNQISEKVRIRKNVSPGDTITVELVSLDRAAYDYWNTLRDVLSSDRAATLLAPSNPNTNLSNGALGYFSACTVDTKKIVIK